MKASEIEMFSLLEGGKSFEDCLRSRDSIRAMRQARPNKIEHEALMLSYDFFDHAKDLYNGQNKTVVRNFFQDVLTRSFT